MAVPTVVGTGAATSSIGAITPALPSGVQENDILVLVTETSGDQSITCTGYTQLLAYGTNAANGSRITVLWKRAGTSESAPTTSDSGDHQLGAIIAIRGCISTGNPFIDYWTGSTTSGTTKSWTPDIPTYVPDVLVLAGLASMTDGFTDSAFSSWTNSSLTNIVEQIDQYTDVGNGGGLGVMTATKAASGTLGTFSVTDGHPTSGVGAAAFVTALIPEASQPFIRGRGIYNATSSTGSFSLSEIPRNIPENDILMVFVQTANQDVTVTGYTQAANSPASNSGTSPTRLSVFWKRAGTSETNPSISDSGIVQIASIVSIGGATSASDPFDVTVSSSGGVGTSVTIPGTTTTVGNTLVLAAASSSRKINNLPNVTFSSWTNSNLTNFNEVIDIECALGGSPAAGGAVGMAAGTKAAAGNYGSTTVTQASSVEYATWSGAIKRDVVNTTLSAESATLTLTGEDVNFGRLFADDSALALSGQSANLVRGITLSAAAGSFATTGNNIALIHGYGISAVSGTLTLDASAEPVTLALTLSAEAGTLTLGSEETQILAGEPEMVALNVLVDLVPERQKGNYQKYNQRLIVDGRTIPVKSWSYDEAEGSIAGSLNVTLANVADRAYLLKTSQIRFEIAEWINNQWRWLPLLNLGKLRQTNYSLIADQTGPADTIQLTASNEAADLLNAAPLRKIIWYDPDKQTIDPDQVEPMIEADGSATPALIHAVSGLDLAYMLRAIYVGGCGFASVSTDIPNFPVSIVTAEAGSPYPNAISGLLGVFEPQTIATGNGPMTVSVRSGIYPPTGGGREVKTDYVNTLSVANNYTRVAGLAVDVTVQRYQWQTSDIVTETETQEIGNTGGSLKDVLTEIETVTTKRRYFTKSQPNIPVREETIKIEQTTFVTMSRWISYISGGGAGWFSNGDGSVGYQEWWYTDEAKQTITVKANESTENFYYDNFGRLYYRRKSIRATIPNPDAAMQITGSIPVAEETEVCGYAIHPYQKNQSYRQYREVNHEGLIFIDGENQQLGSDYARSAIDAWRSGNVLDTMTGSWDKIQTIREDATPKRNDTVELKTVTVDYLASQYVIDDREEKIGFVAANALVNEQRRIFIWGSDRNGIVENANLGEIPMYLAALIGRWILQKKQTNTKTVQVGVVGLDPGLQRGMSIRLYGRSNEFLGNGTIKGRRFDGNENGYTTTLTVAQ